MNRGHVVLISLFVILFGTHEIITAQDVTKAGTVMAPFLKIGVGGRATGMGESFVATANDLTAIYWNPAGLAGLSGNNAYFGHVNWLADLQHNFGAVSLGLGESGTVGAYVIVLGAPDQEITTVESPEGTGQMYSYQDLAFGVSYARKVSDHFAFGLSGKYVLSSLYRLTSSAFAFDFGTIYLIPETSLRIGMALTNFGTKMQYTGDNLERPIDLDPTTTGETDRVTAYLKTQEWDLPLSFKIGLANDFHVLDDVRLTVGVDAVNPNDNRANLNVGGEAAFKEYLFLRGGFKSINLDRSEGGFSLGGGIDLPLGGGSRAIVDYAYTDWGRLNSIHRIGVGFSY